MTPAPDSVNHDTSYAFDATQNRIPAWHLRHHSLGFQILAGTLSAATFVGLRFGFAPWLGDAKVFIFFVLPILICGYLFGSVSGLIVLATGLATTWIHLGAHGQLSPDFRSQQDFYALSLHGLVGLLCLVITNRLQYFQRAEALEVAQKTRIVNLLDSLLDNSPLGIALYDRRLARLRANPRFYDLIELNSKTPGKAANLKDDLGVTYAQLEPSIETVLSSHCAIESKIVEVPTPVIGETRTLSCSFYPVFDEYTYPTGIAVLVNDLTELQKSSEERDRLFELEKQARQSAVVANQMKDEFVAMLSHELRTPLTAILGWSELMRTQSGDPAFSRDAVESITQSTRTLMRMVEDLLDLSRMKTGQLRLDRDIVDVGDVLKEVARNSQQGRDREILVTDQGKCLVDGDHQRLTQVFSNIVDNALKYSGSKMPVRITVSQVNRDIVVTVDDDGIGIDPELIGVIFDRFRQGEAGSRRHYRGLGLGLAIVKELVNLHSGTVSAESPGRDQGSRFTVSLPAALVIRHSSLDRPRETAYLDVDEALTGFRVLLVEDDHETREVLKRMLAFAGAVVNDFDSALAGLDALSNGRYDVIISDIAMPEMDGFEFLSRLREREANGVEPTPAIALSAFTRVKDRQAAFQAGFDAYLNKPVELAKLVQAVRGVAVVAAGER